MASNRVKIGKETPSDKVAGKSGNYTLLEGNDVETETDYELEVKYVTLEIGAKTEKFAVWYLIDTNTFPDTNYYVDTLNFRSIKKVKYEGVTQKNDWTYAVHVGTSAANKMLGKLQARGVQNAGDKLLEIIDDLGLETGAGISGQFQIRSNQLGVRAGGGGKARSGGASERTPSGEQIASSLRAITDKEKEIETAKIPITNFITGYNKRGYTLLFNFIAGNPYYQSTFVKREPGKFSSGVAKMANLGSIDNDRLQTKITGYNEESIGVRGYIHLPLNVSLKSSQTFNYAAKAMALTADFTTSVIRGGVGGAIETAKQKVALGVDTSRSAQQFQGVYNKLFDDSVNIVTKMGAESADIASGISANPRTYEQYTGTAVREFEFAWKFFARNVEESNAINQLITKFRYHAAAKRGKSHPLRMANPDRVVLRMYWVDDGNGEKDSETEYINKFKPLVITGVDVQYGGDVPTYFEGTHAPVEINLTVKLKEQENVYADDIAIGY